MKKRKKRISTLDKATKKAIRDLYYEDTPTGVIAKKLNISEAQVVWTLGF